MSPAITGTLVPPVLPSAPSAPTQGQMYYDSTANILYFWNGTQWVSTQSTTGTIYDSDQVGVVKSWSGQTIPTNWMLADGRALLRASYPDLFNALVITGTGTATSGNATVTGVTPSVITELQQMGAATSGLAIPVDGTYVPAGATITAYQVSPPTVTLSANANGSGSTTFNIAPWGNGDGSTTFRIPDLRSRMLIGANYQGAPALGSDAQITGGAQALVSRILASTGGEQSHLLVAAEGAQNGNATTVATNTGYADTNHYHIFNVNSGNQSANHNHYLSLSGNNVPVTQSGGQGAAVLGGGSYVNAETQGHGHNINSNTDWQSNSYNNSNHYHAQNAQSINARNADNAHNNLPPWCAIALIIKVAGTQINSGGALQGATGVRGSNWSMYVGAGTPPAGTFASELDGDWCFRQSDGEVFKRVSGAWVDQGYVMKQSGLPVVAKSRRGSAVSLAVGWNKIPMDTLVFASPGASGVVDTANGRMVIQTAGYYQVSAQLGEFPTGEILIDIVVNGGLDVATGFRGTRTGGGSQQNAVASGAMQFAVNDTIEVYLYCGTAQSLSCFNGGVSWLTIASITSGPGPQGARGSNWYTYTGAGTPPAGTFLNELDRDMAVRTSDGEVFCRISGAWTDQGWAMQIGQVTMDTWHLIGASGQPTFVSGWTNYGGGYNPGGYRKFPDGKVKLKGLISASSAQSAGAVIFTLPAGYRPPARQLKECETSGTNGARIDILTDGSVSPQVAQGAGAWVSLDDLEFDTESVTVMSAGSQGPRGAGWYSYTGSGTPASNAIPNTQNGDFCIRASDGEVFQMVSGAWVDQGYAIKGSGGGGGGGGAATAVACRMYRNAALTLASGATWTRIPLDTISFDTSNMASVANGRIQIPQGGYYQVNAEVLFTVSGTGTYTSCAVGIYKNGSLVIENYAIPAIQTYGSASVSDILQCSAGDYIELYAINSQGTALYTNTVVNALSVSQVASANLTTAPVTPARAYRGTTLTPAAGWNKLTVDTIGTDPGANFTLATGRYVCPASGWYQVNAHVEWINATSGQLYGAGVYKNGASVAFSTTPGTGIELGTGTSDVIQCNAGDYLELWSYSGNGTIAVGTAVANTYLSVSQVGNVSSVSAPTSTMAARGYRNAALSLSTGSNKVPLDTVSYDTSGLLQTANGRIVCPVAGLYQVNGSVYPSVANATIECQIWKNGVQVLSGSQVQAVAAGGSLVQANDIIQCNAGDYLELYAYTSVAGPLSVGTQNLNFLSVALISSLPGTAGPVTPARAYRNAAFSVTASGITKIPLDAVQYDPGGNVNTAQGRYNVPATGTYAISARVIMQAPASSTDMTAEPVILVNGATRSSGGGASRVDNSQYVRMTHSDILSLNAGDYVELGVYSSAAITYTCYVGQTGEANSLSIAQVGNLSSVSAPTSTMAARAYRNAALTLTAGATQKIPLDTASFDTSGMVSTANGRINISQAGYYDLQASAGISGGTASADGLFQVQIWVNGAARVEGNRNTRLDQFGAALSMASDTMSLNAGDYVELYCYATSAWAVQVGAVRNYLSLSLVSSLPGAVGPTTPARMHKAGFTSPAASAQVMPFDVLDYDPGGNINLATYRYTCPATGYYQVDWTLNSGVGPAGTNITMYASIYKNGAGYGTISRATETSTDGWASVGGSDLIPCNAGDYLQLYYYTSGAWNNTSAQFAVAQVGNQMAIPASTVCARGYRNAAFSLSGPGWTKVPIDTAAFDTSGAVQAANGRLVAPVAGYYQVQADVALNATSSLTFSLLISLYKNGAEVSRGTESNISMNATNGRGQNVTDIVYCNAGDYLEMYVYNSYGSLALSVGSPLYNYLSMALLTPLSGTAGPTSAARAYRNAAYTLPANGWQKIPIDTKDFDPGNNISTSANRYTAPATGYYQVNGEVALGPTTGNISVMVHSAIYVNGTYVRSGTVVSNSDNNGYMRAGVADILSLNAGDYVELWCYSLTAYALLVGPSYNYLSVTQVGNSMQFKSAGGDLTGNYPTPQLAPPRGRTQIGGMSGLANTTSLAMTFVGTPTTGNGMTVSGNGFKVPTKGYYRVQAVETIASLTPAATSYIQLGFTVNGANVPNPGTFTTGLTAAATGYPSVTAFEQLSLNAGDVVGVTFYNGSGAATSGNAGIFTIEYIGQ